MRAVRLHLLHLYFLRSEEAFTHWSRVIMLCVCVRTPRRESVATLRRGKKRKRKESSLSRNKFPRSRAETSRVERARGAMWFVSRAGPKGREWRRDVASSLCNDPFSICGFLREISAAERPRRSSRAGKLSKAGGDRAIKIGHAGDFLDLESC